MRCPLLDDGPILHHNAVKVAMQQSIPYGLKPWNRGLLTCTEDCGTCLLACCVPCLTHGQIMEREGDSCAGAGLVYMIAAMFGFGSCIACSRRQGVRQRRGIQGDCCSDYMTVCCCEPCAQTQEWNEVTKFPMAINAAGAVVIMQQPPATVVVQQQGYPQQYGAPPQMAGYPAPQMAYQPQPPPAQYP
ncbi:PLAC8-domain-containing protein [Gonapodya prolifera JEL478]|uniref:PLAC8-domain-containing protein n=1 Tax=Gonapodya prolifera (strain JEL478) TaxID=1344416 RepID=A0A139A954_GONPJ|nr:PLAC8-domain-containing protein [Gonapodya prolifera JEL478]|eukprot:KXS13296.1 PLAC8-domain-containing protein [Gonapodya prolifera JEL478]